MGGTGGDERTGGAGTLLGSTSHGTLLGTLLGTFLGTSHGTSHGTLLGTLVGFMTVTLAGQQIFDFKFGPVENLMEEGLSVLAWWWWRG